MKRAFHLFVKLLFSALVVSFYKRFLSRLLILLPSCFTLTGWRRFTATPYERRSWRPGCSIWRWVFFFFFSSFPAVIQPDCVPRPHPDTHIRYMLDIDTTSTTSSSSSSPSLHTCLPQQQHLLHQQFVQPRSLIAAGLLWLSAGRRQPVKRLERALSPPPPPPPPQRLQQLSRSNPRVCESRATAASWDANPALLKI